LSKLEQHFKPSDDQFFLQYFGVVELSTKGIWPEEKHTPQKRFVFRKPNLVGSNSYEQHQLNKNWKVVVTSRAVSYKHLGTNG